MKRIALILSLLAAPAWAENPMTGPEFDAYTIGKTLGYGVNGVVWGIEEYLPDRRVRWAFVGEECKSGRWYEPQGYEPQKTRICFVYQEGTDEHCWQFYLRGDRLAAQSISDGPSAPLAELSQDHGLSCPGPAVGV
jgi:hypothetical protein